MPLKTETLKQWNKELGNDPQHSLGSTVLKNFNFDEVLLDRKRLTEQSQWIFNVGINPDTPSPVTNQRASGRCWLFAATNALRLPAIEHLQVKELELSQSYCFFYDKLEKANYFLDQIVKSSDESVDSRLVQWLLRNPTEDGGQYSMFQNLVSKYGLIPKDLYGDEAYSTTASRKWNEVLAAKLREMAQRLRETPNKEVAGVRARMQREIFELMTLFMDLPPVGPNEEFTWSYKDKDQHIHTLCTTPIRFAQEVCGIQNETLVSLINDPRHPYGELIRIDRLGNVIGGNDVIYLNVDNDTLSQLVVERLRKNKPVFFGSHTPKFMDRKTGMMDVKLWNHAGVGYQLNQDKASRIKYGESLMTHAMLITGAFVDEDHQKPIRYRVENSWGKDSGKDGLYLMTQEYFEEYAFQIVVDLKDLKQEYQEKFNNPESAIVLPMWDPMGALAD